MTNANTETLAGNIPPIEQLVEQFHAAQRNFLESQEYMDYYWSLDSLTMEIDRPRSKLVFPIIPVGTWSPLTEQFTWAFAISKFPASARDAAEQLKGVALKFEAPDYTPDQFSLSHMELDDVLAMARFQLDCEVIFKEKAMEPWLFFALLSPSEHPIVSTKTQKKNGL